MNAVLTAIVWILLAIVFVLAVASLVFVVTAGTARAGQRAKERLGIRASEPIQAPHDDSPPEN